MKSLPEWLPDPEPGETVRRPRRVATAASIKGNLEAYARAAGGPADPLAKTEVA